MLRTDPDWNCPLNEMGYNVPDWDPTYYSPVCRSWYKLQFKNQDHQTVSFYPFSDGRFGMTTCTPITDHSNDDKFTGALCSDIKPHGDL